MNKWDALTKLKIEIKYPYLTIFLVFILVFSSTFFGITVSSEEHYLESHIICKINFDEPNLSTVEINNNIYTIIQLPNCISDSQIGDPAIPFYPARLLIPQNKEVISISISYKRPVKINYDFVKNPIMPEQECLPFSSVSKPVFEINETIYNLNEPVLKETFKDGKIGFCRGFKILTVFLFPITYIPKKGEVCYYPEMTIKINLKDFKSKDNKFLRLTDSDKKFVEEIIDNPEETNNYDLPSAPLGGGDSPMDYTDGLCDPNDSYDFVIITSNSLKDTTGYSYNWSDLIDHRQSYSGLSGTIITVEEIDACSSYWNETSIFNDTQAHIREFCKDAYEDWNAQYVILGGDWDSTSSHQIVPYRLFTDRYETETFDTMACDKYYSHLDGDWYYTTNSIWGGGTGSGSNDLYGELYVGRICAYTAETVSNAVNKIINYDLNSSLTDDWLSSVSFWGGNLGWSSTSKQYMEEIRLGTDTYRTFTGFEEWNNANPEDQIDTSECLYHADLGSNYKNYFYNSVEDDNASMINHLDHSNYNSPFGLSNWYYTYNTKPFFGYSQGCLAGRYHEGYAGCEQMICRHPERHAFALVLNTGYGYGSTSSTNGASQYINAYFWDYFFNDQSNNKNNWQLGKAFLYASDKMGAVFDYHSHSWCYAWYSAHYFGDPAQKLRISNEDNNAVQLSYENPSDGSSGVTLLTSSLNVTMKDTDGDVFNWTIQTSPDIGTNYGNNENNGSKTCSVSGLSYSTSYNWYVNVTDGQKWTNETYSFSTAAAPTNDPPTITSPSIENESVDVSILTSSLSVTINEPEGDNFDWTIETFPDIGSSSGDDESNGSKSLSISGLSYFTDYKWYVNVTDGNSWSRHWYTFTTRSQYIPNIPDSFSAIADGRFQIDLSWNKGDNADYTYIEFNTISSWNRNIGTQLYNNTGYLISHTGLNPGDTFYYQAWSWNLTDNIWSSGVICSATTDNNNIISFGSPNPGNGSINQPLTLTWNIYISDSDGDSFNWTIECSNGQSSSANSANNGIKQLYISDINYNSSYIIWVNATDSYDFNREWFAFITGSPPVISNIVETTSNPIDTDSSFGWVNISCQVTDNIEVSEVYINITNPNGSYNNLSMNSTTTNIFFLNSSTAFSVSGNFSYIIWSTDNDLNAVYSNNYIFSMPPNNDINMDGIQNVLDLILISNYYGYTGNPGWCREDFDNNGIIQVIDLIGVANKYGETWWM